jgi:hypothetical protein
MSSLLVFVCPEWLDMLGKSSCPYVFYDLFRHTDVQIYC